MHPQCLIIGIGNEYRCDDGAGLMAAREIQQKNIPSLFVKEQSGEGAALMDAWQGFDHVILVDVVSSGAEPGTIYRIEALKEKFPLKFFHYSAHAFGVAEAVELARSLRKLPSHMVFHGVEGRNFKAGISISPEVWEGIDKIIENIVVEIESLD